MVIQIRISKMLECTPLIRGLVEDRFKLKYVNFLLWKTPKEVSILLSGKLSPREVLTQASTSKVLHGIFLNDDIKFHPDSVIHFMAERLGKLIKRELKRKPTSKLSDVANGTTERCRR